MTLLGIYMDSSNWLYAGTDNLIPDARNLGWPKVSGQPVFGRVYVYRWSFLCVRCC
jgi:hypothetical protein